jgi:phosphoglycerate dehydrogenase-like enzyme
LYLWYVEYDARVYQPRRGCRRETPPRQPVSNTFSPHCPLTSGTPGRMNAATPVVMPPEAILINIARGTMVCIDAPPAALRNSAVAGALRSVS